jgi:hypothetical protein
MDYTNFFKLCGFDDEELKKESRRIDRAFQKLGIDENDVKRGEERIQTYYNVEFEGVRTLLGIWMKELIALTLAREEKKKVIYSEWPGLANIMLMGAMHACNDAYFGSPASQTLNIVMGSIFDKLTPILEAGERSGLTPGKAHCALWMTHIGSIVKGLIPEPDLMIAAGWLCDQAAEADQLLHHITGIPTVYVDGCLDWQFGEGPDFDRRQISYTGASLRRVKEKVEEVIGCQITDQHMQAGFMDMGQLFFNFQTLSTLVGKADPQPISQTNLDLPYWMFYTPMLHKREANQAVLTLCKEVKPLVDQGKGIVPKGAPKVYCAIRIAVDPSIVKMIEGAGLSLSCMMADYLMPGTLEAVKATDPCELMAEGVYRMGTIVRQGSGTMSYIRDTCRDWKVDGCIVAWPYSCRLTSCMYFVKDCVQKELGIPALMLEGDAYDTRQYSAAALRTRIEAFAEMLRMRKSLAA